MTDWALLQTPFIPLMLLVPVKNMGILKVSTRFESRNLALKYDTS